MDGGPTYEDAEESRGNFSEKRTGLTAFLGYPVFSCFSAALGCGFRISPAIFFENRDHFCPIPWACFSHPKQVEVDGPNQLVQPFHWKGLCLKMREGGSKISHKKMANCCFVI